MMHLKTIINRMRCRLLHFCNIIKKMWRWLWHFYHSTKGFWYFLIPALITLWATHIMWQDLKLTHRPFLEIRPVRFYQDSAWRGEDKTQVWCHLDFEITNHGRTPIYDVKIDKLDVVLDRKIDLIKVLDSNFKHMCIFPNRSIVITHTVTNSKVDTQKILDGEKQIEYDIEVRYRGPREIRESEYYWYKFRAKTNIENQLMYSDIEGN